MIYKDGSFEMRLELLTNNCECGKRHWEILSANAVRTELCAYCRTVKYLNRPMICFKMDDKTIRALLVAEYEESINKTIKNEIISILFGAKNDV